MRDLKSCTIAVLGGSGRVGSRLRQELCSKVAHVRVLDLVEPLELGSNEVFRSTDIGDLSDLQAAFEGVDGIVHLAGIPKEAPLDEILTTNVTGTTNVYEAARRAGVDRVVLGSSNHVMGCYPRTERIGSSDPMRPDGLYGLSKSWGELVAGLFYDKHGIKSLIVRIGNSSIQPLLPRSLEVWISPKDLCQLTVIGLTHENVTATTVYGVSKGGGSWWDNSVASSLGYSPEDLITDFAAPEAFMEDKEGEVSRYFQGGKYVEANHDGIIRNR